MSFVVRIFEAFQNAVFVALLPAFVFSLLLLFVRGKKVLGKSFPMFLFLVITLAIMMSWRVMLHLGTRRYYYAIIELCICITPLAIKISAICKDRWKAFATLLASAMVIVGIVIAVGKCCRVHKIPHDVTECADLIKKEVRTNGIGAGEVYFSCDHKRVVQILFYSGLPAKMRWMPHEHPKWSSMAFFREYRYRFIKKISPQEDLFWVIRTPTKEDEESTLGFMSKRHGFHVVGIRRSGRYCLYHLRRDVNKAAGNCGDGGYAGAHKG